MPLEELWPVPVTLVRSDGLHILSKATLAQLADDKTLRDFAAGLVPQALRQAGLFNDASRSLAGALYDTGLQTRPLFVALLALDAEVRAVVDDTRRALPLPGFLTYRPRLSPDKFPLDTVRLPPLNPDGHYILAATGDGFCFAIRLDLHPRLKVAGHVRMAVSSPNHAPFRLQTMEHRLERQVLSRELIELTVLNPAEELTPPLSAAGKDRLIEVLRGLLEA